MLFWSFMALPFIQRRMAHQSKDSIEVLHLAIHQETEKLKEPRLGVLKLNCCVCHASEPPLEYHTANVCALLREQQRLNTGGLIYLDPSYLVAPPPTPELSQDEQPKSPETLLLHTIQISAIFGGDKIALNGQNQKRRMSPESSRTDPRTHYVRCQYSRTYCGGKVDKETGRIIMRTDYRPETIRNNRKKQQSTRFGGTEGFSPHRNFLSSHHIPRQLSF